MLKRHKPVVDSSIERSIAIGAITSTQFLKELIPIYKDSRSVTQLYIGTLIDLCIEYFEHYDEAPYKHIQDIFIAHRDNGIPPDQVEQMEYFLGSISEEYEEDQSFNVEYVLNRAEEHFRINELTKVRDKLSQCISGGRVDDGEAAIAKFERITRTKTEGIDPLRDSSAIIEAFDPENNETMFGFPGDFGKMIGKFCRGELAMIVAPMGRGKSWFLQEVGLRALFSGYNVLFVSLEMSKNQMIRRIQHSITGLPSERHSGKILVPVFDCQRSQIGQCVKSGNTEPLLSEGQKPDFDKAPEDYTPCDKCRVSKAKRAYKFETWFKEIEKEAITSTDALAKSASIVRSVLRGGSLRMINPPPNSMSVSSLKTVLINNEHYDGWIPDVIITDYADKFAPEDTSINEYRHRIYQTILAHKALANERDCLVVTASQSNTGRSDKKHVGEGDFAEDIRKKAEIDIGWSLSQTPEEKSAGVIYAKVMKSRHDDFDVRQKCAILQQLKIGKPYLDSQFV
ncbi:MAG: hypothetical protein DRP08_02970 [Candidatus Aenigmatarchaeota archaeon]|nr:MAG: hypothetical protein DRP08_02970 [Candidatus Aenigmarchaeota archaeon]